MLTIQEDEYELEKDAEINFDPWKMHIISVAKNDQIIADKVDGMYSNKAYILGLFDEKCGSNIYSLLPNVKKNSYINLMEK